VNRQRENVVFLLCILFIMLSPAIIANDSSSVYDWEGSGIQTTIASNTAINYTEDWSQACSSVIVTGNATRDGHAILMKNRDLADEPVNVPIYVPATPSTHAFIGVNTNAMGINEKGLAVMNTYLPALAGSEPILGNLLLNQLILEYYDSVSDVAQALNDSYSLIGPVHRPYLGSVATCIGVIDRFGSGAFFEVSDTKAYVQYVVDGYDTRANHPRIYPGAASGPSGRDQYLLDALDEIYNENGYISPEHVMQNVSRYIHHKEIGSVNFSIDGEACNPATVASMVAVSGDERYDGILNCMWTACGSNPIVGVFVPSMVCAHVIPESIEDLWIHTRGKYASARAEPLTSGGLLYPERVREVQKFAFFAEDYTVSEYERLMSSVPNELLDYQIMDIVRTFIEGMDNYASEIFIEETTNVDPPPQIDFPVPSLTTSTSPTGTTLARSTTDSPTNPASSPSESLYDDQLLTLTVGAVSGFALVMVVAAIKRRYT
jgi:hypothetical protein